MGYWRSLLMESRFIASMSVRFKVVSNTYYQKSSTCPSNCLFYFKRLAMKSCEHKLLSIDNIEIDMIDLIIISLIYVYRNKITYMSYLVSTSGTAPFSS